MPATVTLSTTTLQANVSNGETQVKVASTTGLTPGTRLFVEGEVMSVVSLGVNPWVNVNRGVDGTASLPHNSLATVYIAAPNQLYATNPVGRPPAVIAVSPWINVKDNRVWFAQGDTLPYNVANRWWQEALTNYDTSVLGVTVATQSPTSSS